MEGVWAVDRTNPGGPGSEHADARGSGILEHAHLASSLWGGPVRGSSQDWRVVLCQQLATNPGTKTTGLDGKHGRCPAQEARLLDKMDHFLPRPDQSSAQHILELVAWRQPWFPSAGAHAPRRCRASDREATGNVIFDFLNNEKCTCRSDHTAGATGREAVPAGQMPCV